MSLGVYNGAGSGITKLLLHMEGNSTDSSGNGNNGTDSNMSYGVGKFGQGVTPNGTTSKITITNSASLQLGTNDVTFSAWFKCPSAGGEINPIFEKSSATSPYPTYFFRVLANNKMIFAITDYSSGANWGSGSTRWYCSSTTSVNDNLWHNVVAVRISTGYLLYLDGKLDGTRTETARNSDNTSNLTVLTDSNSEFSNMPTDEIIIENRAWSASEISKYYTMAKGRFGII